MKATAVLLPLQSGETLGKQFMQHGERFMHLELANLVAKAAGQEVQMKKFGRRQSDDTGAQ